MATRILVVDVETTGLSSIDHSIVEIGAAWLLDPGAERYHTRCHARQGGDIDPKAIEINGCDWLHDKSLPSETEAVCHFLDWIGPGPCILAGMNPDFDLDFILGPLPCDRELPFVHRKLDLHSLAVAYAIALGHPIPDRGLYSDEIMRMIGLEPEARPHRALAGVLKEIEAFKVFLGVPSTLRHLAPAGCPIDFARFGSN